MITVKAQPLSLKPLIDPYAVSGPINWTQVFGASRPLTVEIGCGLGEFIVRTAQDNPQDHFVGMDLEWKRVCKTLRKIQLSGLDNVRIMKIDARVAFERLFAAQSIERVYCLFPCPWPKKRHAKHRLFSNAFLRLSNSRLAAKGEVRIVTDHEPYTQWFLEEAAGTGFKIDSKTIKAKYDTKFERKWLIQGQTDFFELFLKKIRHLDVPLKEDIPLPAFVVDGFSPENFEMPAEKGEISVILKRFLFNPQQQKSLVHVVACEEHLTQHVRIGISLVHGHWEIFLEKGFRVFPTDGVRRALEIVYEAVKRSAQTAVC